jgi:hypothetical protein
MFRGTSYATFLCICPVVFCPVWAGEDDEVQYRGTLDDYYVELRLDWTSPGIKGSLNGLGPGKNGSASSLVSYNIEARNDENGRLTGTLRKEQKKVGEFTVTKKIDAGYIVWSGPAKIQSGRRTKTEHLEFFRSGTNTNESASGNYIPGIVLASVKKDSSASFEMYLKKNGFPYDRSIISADDPMDIIVLNCGVDYKTSEAFQYTIRVPGFKENELANKFSHLDGLSVSACRDSFPSAPEPNFVDIKQGVLFPGGIDKSSLERRLNGFVSDWFGDAIRSKKTEVTLIPNLDFNYEIKIDGISEFGAFRQAGQWERVVITLVFGRGLSSESDEIRCMVQVRSGELAKWVETDRPVDKKYAPAPDSLLDDFQKRVVGRLVRNFHGLSFAP